MPNMQPSGTDLPAQELTSNTLSQAENDSSEEKDLESNALPSSQLVNNEVYTFGWKAMNVTVKDRATKLPLSILTDANGLVKAGELIAIMGPSGSGKTTLLNTLAHRVATAGAATQGDTLMNGQAITWQALRHLSAYVEQEDALIGSLTVRETMNFAARLALPRYVYMLQLVPWMDINLSTAPSPGRSASSESMISLVVLACKCKPILSWEPLSRRVSVAAKRNDWASRAVLSPTPRSCF